MKDLSMDSTWRLVQVFIGFDGVSEVSVESEDRKQIACTCAEFISGTKCKHYKFVKEAIAANGGDYVVQVPIEMDEDLVVEAMMDADTWRAFVRKYARVLTID